MAKIVSLAKLRSYPYASWSGEDKSGKYQIYYVSNDEDHPFRKGWVVKVLKMEVQLDRALTDISLLQYQVEDLKNDVAKLTANGMREE